MTSYALGFQIAKDHLERRLLPLGAALMVLFVASVAWLERTDSASGALDRSLLGVVFGWALPLTSFFIISDISGQERLAFGHTRLGRYGHSQHQLVLGSLGGAFLLIACFTLLYAWVAFGIATPSFGGSALSDAITTSWIAVLGSLAYMAWFAFWSTWGRRGGGRIFGLLLDWVLGFGTSFGALFSPRAHLSNLLGSSPPMALDQATSTGALFGLTLICLSLGLRRVDP